MTFGSDLVARARLAASKKNRKVVMAKPDRALVDESSSHTPIAEEEITKERSSSSTIEKDISDDDDLHSEIPSSIIIHIRKLNVNLSSNVILRRELGCPLKFSTFLVLHQLCY